MSNSYYWHSEDVKLSSGVPFIRESHEWTCRWKINDPHWSDASVVMNDAVCESYLQQTD